MNTRLKQSSFKHNFGLYTFIASILLAILLFVPFIILGNGIFFYYGDFNVQEIPFYQLAHDYIRTGGSNWHNLTDLGSDFISSYSFYLLGSPFFWLTIPFPSEAVPYLIGPLLILKFGCAGLIAYLYLKRHTKRRINAMIGGILYAFSGFSIYNVFFFHFHEPLIVFPLLLAALDAFIYDNKRGIFALAACVACVVNYYFFVGQVFFVIIYFLMITFTKTYKFRLSNFLMLALEVAIGFLASCFILVPSVLGVIENPRLESIPQGWDTLVYSQPQRYWLIILSFFFPADTAAFPVFTPDSNCKWASVAGWLPLFGMTGVIAYLQLRKRDWLKKIITLLMLLALIPITNSMFQLFNTTIFYARWYYMIELILVLATLRALEDSETDWNRAVCWSAGITTGLAVFIGAMPLENEDENDAISYTLGVQADFPRFWLYVMLAMMSLLGFALIYKKFKPFRRRFNVILLIGVCISAYLCSLFVIASGYVSSDTREPIIHDILGKRENIEIKDLDEVRSDLFNCVDNTQMFWQIQSINCFQSSVSASIMKFYNALGITRDVASRPDTSAYGLRSFLSCKYLFDYIPDNEEDIKNSFILEDGSTRMPNWTFNSTSNNFNIYENESYIPMGFVFDKFITEEEFKTIQTSYRSEALLYAMVLSKEVMEKYPEITGYTQEKYSALYRNGKEIEQLPNDFESITTSFKYGIFSYTANCEKLKANSCSDFRYTDKGFDAHFNNKGKENLLFFTVPYSTGFTAKVNGEAVEVEKADYGFMAIKIPAETECEIEFNYETPGFSLGKTITICSLGAFIIYIGLIFLFRKRSKKH